MNRDNPKWQDLSAVSGIDLELRSRELVQIFRTTGGVGLLQEIYEEDDVVRIIAELE